jgi:hypothetical protein
MISLELGYITMSIRYWPLAILDTLYLDQIV